METKYSNTAYIIKRFHELRGESPCKKELQKIAFLIEEKGVALGYNHGLHFYGPYSSTLDAYTMSLSSDGVVKIDYSGYSHLLCVNEEDFDIHEDGLTKEQLAQVDEVITRFEKHSASDLELLTTAIYAYNHLDDKTIESVVAGVQKIKGSKYSETKIQTELENLEYFGKTFV